MASELNKNSSSMISLLGQMSIKRLKNNSEELIKNPELDLQKKKDANNKLKTRQVQEHINRVFKVLILNIHLEQNYQIKI